MRLQFHRGKSPRLCKSPRVIWRHSHGPQNVPSLRWESPTPPFDRTGAAPAFCHFLGCLDETPSTLPLG